MLNCFVKILSALSLSARRAWIEIEEQIEQETAPEVALRKESVDRNFYYADKDADWVRSLSARRAWIEILYQRQHTIPPRVALRKESVDRNILPKIGLMLVVSVALRKESVDRNSRRHKSLTK